MAYNLTFTPEQWPGHVPFIDTDHLRFIRGGLTIDAAQVEAVRAAGEAAGQAVLRNGQLTLLQGSYISQNPGTDKYEVYAPAFAVTQATRITGDAANNQILWTAVAVGAAGNAVSVEVVDEMRGAAAPAVFVDGDDIRAVLANPTSVVANANNGGVADDLIEFVARAGGDAGNDIVINLIDPAALSDLEIEVVFATNTINVTLQSTAVPALESTAIEVVNALRANVDAMSLIDVYHGLGSAGTGVVPEELAITTANGDDGTVADALNNGAALVTLATPIVAAVAVPTNVGTGADPHPVVAAGNLTGGAPGNQAVQAGLITGIADLETAIRWRALDAYIGAAGNAVSIEFLDPGPGPVALSVAEAAGPPATVIVTLQTNAAGDILSTAADIVALIQAEVLATTITFVNAELACAVGNGVVGAMAATNMTGGVNATAANIANRYATILFEDVVLVDSQGNLADAVATGLDHGRVLNARLPLAPDAAVRTALPQVIFK